MLVKDRTRLQKLNAVINSIDRVIDTGLQWLQQTTTDDLKAFRDKLNRERQELCKKCN